MKKLTTKEVGEMTMKIAVMLVAMVFLAGCFGFAVTEETEDAALFQDEWTMFRHDLGHSGYSSSPTAPDTSSVTWSYPLVVSQTGNGVYGSVAVAGGKVYTTSGDGYLHCLSLSGGFIWKSLTINMHGMSSSSAVANGKVFVGCDSQPRMYAFDANTGAKVWEYVDVVTMDGIYSSPMVTGGRVYFGTDTSKVLCLPENDPNGDGTISASEVIWSKTMPDKVWSSPAIVGNNLYIGCGDGNSAGSNVFYCMNATNGFTAWTYPTSGNIGDVISAPLVSSGFVYFGATNNNVYCLNANTGSLVWSTPLGGGIWSSPALAYGRLFIGCNDYKLYCLDANTGSQIWNYPTGGKIWSSPSVAANRVYFGSCDKYVYCLDAIANTATLIWSLEIATGGGTNGVPGSPTIYEGLMFIGGWDSTSPRLYCFGSLTTGDTTKPGQTTDLAVSNPTTNSLTLTWTAPADNGTDPASGNAFGYDVRYTTAGIIDTDAKFNSAIQCTGEPTPGTPGTTETFVVSGLNPSTTYYFALKTRDEVPNWSLLSNSPSGTTTGGGGDITAPAQTTDLAAGSPTPNSITLTWTAPADNGTDATSGTAFAYDIRYSTSDITNDAEFNAATQATGEPTPGVVGTSESFTVTGLGSGTTYYFALKTRDEVPNWSPLSNSASATTSSGGGDTTPPAQTTDLAAGSPTPNSITLTWTAPADNGTELSSGKATQYDIRYLAGTTPITDANWNSATQCTGGPVPGTPGSSEAFKLIGLTPNTQYYFAIKTADEVPNWSSISNSPTATTQAGGGPQLVVTAPDTVDENTDFDVTVTANGNPVGSVTVTFNSVDKITGANGKVTHTAPSVTSDTICIITANRTGYTDGTRAITVRNVAQQPSLYVTVTADPTTVYSGSLVYITIKVISNGSDIAGASVTLSDDGAGGMFSSITEMGNGEYSTTYTTPTSNTPKTVIIITIKATAIKNGYTQGSGVKEIIVKPKDSGEITPDNTMLYILIMAAVIILVVVLLLALLLKKKKKVTEAGIGLQPEGTIPQPQQTSEE